VCEPLHHGEEQLVTGAGSECDEDSAILGVTAAKFLDRWPESLNSALLTPAGAIDAQPVLAALGGDGVVYMAVVTGEDAEYGATACHFLAERCRTQVLETGSKVLRDRACTDVK
jgi:hypothetical protein